MKQSNEKKRFNTAQEILDAIEALKVKMADREKKAAELQQLKKDAAANAARSDWEGATAAAEFWRDQMNDFLLKENRARSSAGSIREKRIPELGQRLAEFQTEPLAFLGGDRSIEV